LGNNRVQSHINIQPLLGFEKLPNPACNIYSLAKEDHFLKGEGGHFKKEDEVFSHPHPGLESLLRIDST